MIEALKDKNDKGYDLTGKNVYYIAPTFEQGKRIMWDLFKELGRDIITHVHENTGALTIMDKCKIEIKGADRPDTLRGVGLRYVILDEYADMKPIVWENIIRPALSDVEGSALFIGTPKGKNHFYNLYLEAQQHPDEYKTFSFKTVENPTLNSEETETARKSMSTDTFRQEYEASFTSSGGGTLKEEWITIDKTEPMDGYYYVTMDPAGFADVKQAINSKLKRLDETAISVVKVHSGGWWVKDMQVGRWGIRETALRFIKACHDVHALTAGIEKGSLHNAIMPYIEDTCRRLNVYPNIQALTHGGKKKTERIIWALQGRFEHGKIILNEGKWNTPFIEQYLDFPNPMAHDDMLDSLAYIDQISIVPYDVMENAPTYEPLDPVAGY